MYRAVVAGAVCCWAAGAAHTQENLERREGVHLEQAGVVNGALRAGKGLRSGWLIRKTPQGVLIYLAGGEEAGGWSGWYLNYDHRGKDPAVGLVPEPGPGCYWTWTEGAWRKNPGGFGYTFRCTARPANGPLRGWALTSEGGKLVLAREAAVEVGFRGEIDDLNDGK
jgi:hypothetical protein